MFPLTDCIQPLNEGMADFVGYLDRQQIGPGDATVLSIFMGNICIDNAFEINNRNRIL